MALINQNNIIGITSITSPGASNVLTFHTSDTTERLRVTTGGLSFSGTNSSLDSSGNASFNGNVSIGGTLTYEDVTNIDAVGVITARSGINVTGGQLNLAGNMQFTAADPELEFNNGGPRFRVPAANTLTIHTGGGLGATTNERLRITSAGNIGVGVTTPGALLSIPAGESNTPRFAIESAVDDNDFTITQYEDGNGTYTMLGQNVKLNSGGNNTILDSGHKTAGILLDARNHGAITFITGGTNAVTEPVKITSDGDVSISSTGTVHGVSKLTLLPADRTSTFDASNGDTWHDVVLMQNGNATNNAVGIAFEVGNSGSYHKNAGTGICAVKNGTNSDYGADLVFVTRPQSAVAQERLRITSDGFISFKNSSPPAWSTDSGYANATFGSSGYLRTDTDVNGNFLSIGSNAYRSSSGWKHTNSGWATQLQTSANSGDLTYSVSTTSGSADGNVSWSEKLRVSSDGEVTKPLQPRFHARLTTDQTSYDGRNVGGSWIIFNTTDYDIGNNFVTSGSDQGRFVAPVSGLYLFQAAASIWTGNPGWSQSWFDVDGSRKHGTDWVVSGAFDMDFAQNSVQVYLTAGQKIGFHPYNANNGNTVLDSVYHTWFKGCLLG